MPFRLGIASMSLGQPHIHPLPAKLHQAALHGYQGIEIFFEDLDCLAHSQFQGNHHQAAREARRLCDHLHLSIICLQPFSLYEGLLDRTQHEHLVTNKLPLWFALARILGTDIVQIPSNFLQPDPETGMPRTTGDTAVIVSDLRRIADLGLSHSPPFRFVYEALAWGNHVNTWDQSWEIVQKVDRPNFGLCLDTFNIAGRVYADPASPTGKTAAADADIQASIARIRNIDMAKVFYVQIVDGERLKAPLDEKHEFHVKGQPARMSWSRNARLFPFEEDRGGYLPVVDIAQAFFDLGFQGWVSLELFSRTLADPDPNTPRDHARRGRESWEKLAKAVGLDPSAYVCSSNAPRAADGAVSHTLSREPGLRQRL